MRTPLLACLLSLLAAGAARAEDGPGTASRATAAPTTSAEAPAGAWFGPAGDAPMSIYGGNVRAFKFLIEDRPVDIEEIVTVMRGYDDGEHPPLLAAMPDVETNSLILIGPPEAEDHYRAYLVRRQHDLLGVHLSAGSSLGIRKRFLLSERWKLVERIADFEISVVVIADSEEHATDAERRTELAGQRTELEEELARLERQVTVVERKLAVVDRNHERLARVPTLRE